MVVGSIVLALLLVLGGVWGLGGFEKRTDILIPSEPGSLVVSGPYEFVFTGATAQQKQDFDDAPYWEVVVTGTVANTGTEALYPPYLDNGMFVAKDPASGEVQQPSIATIGDAMTGEHSRVTPGLPPVPYRVEFKYGKDYRPGPTLRFVAFQIEFTDINLTGDEKTWNNGTRAYVFTLPVQVLAADLN